MQHEEMQQEKAEKKKGMQQKYSKAALLYNEVTKAIHSLSFLIFDTHGGGDSFR